MMSPAFKAQVASAIRRAGPGDRVRVIPAAGVVFTQADAYEAGWMWYAIKVVEAREREQEERRQARAWRLQRRQFEASREKARSKRRAQKPARLRARIAKLRADLKAIPR